MIIAVYKTQTENEGADWQIATLEDFLFGESILRMDNNSVYIRPPSFLARKVFSKKPNRRLSLLRGKMNRQSEKEIDDQISDLRNEWYRNI